MTLKMKNIKAIIFDMDGTLVDNIPYHKQAWILFLQKYGFKMDTNSFNAQNHGTIDEMIVRFFGKNLSEKTIKELGKEKEKTYRSLYKPYIKEVTGLKFFLQDLEKKQIKIMLATMGDKDNINFILESLNIMSSFSSITGGNEITKGKPDPEIYNSVLSKNNLKNNECIAIEDSIGGIQSALDAGLQVIGITTTHTKSELIDAGCYKVIDDFTNTLAGIIDI